MNPFQREEIDREPESDGGLGWTDIADGLWLTAVVGTEDDAQVAVPSHPNVESAPSTGTPTVTPQHESDTRTERHGSATDESANTPTVLGLSADLDKAGTGLTTGTPTATTSPLPHSREFARALRPFKRRIPSKTEVEFDEEATADRAAEDGLWLPQTQAIPSRWLSLALVIDESPTMAVWRPTIAAFRRLLEHHGAFRNVRTYFLDTQTFQARARSPADTSVRIRGPGTGPRDPGEVLDPSGRQIVAVLTDGLNEFWREPIAASPLRLWGRAGPVAIVNPFPQSYWQRTHLAPRRAQVRAARAVTPNIQLGLRCPAAWLSPFDEPWDDDQMPVPLLELHPRWMRWWADLITDPRDRWIDAAVFLVATKSGAATDAAATSVGAVDQAEGAMPDLISATSRNSAGARQSPRDMVLRFRTNASPLAFRLATYLAAAPLELPFLRVLQHTMLPQSHPVHLAEVFASGLIQFGTDGGTQDTAPFDFTGGVREALLAGATREESARVVRAVAQHYGDRHPEALGMTRALEAPESVPDPPVTPETLPLVKVELAVLRALSGPYAQRAQRLDRAIAELEHSASAQAHKTSDPDNLGVAAPDSQDVAVGDGENMPTSWEHNPDDPSGPQDESAPGSPAIGTPQDATDFPVDDLLGLETLQTGPAVWGNVPARNPVFTGRHELLQQLERRLLTEHMAAVLPQALHGMGGVGKSQIAIEYTYRHRSDYDVVWWIPAEQPSQVLAALIELGRTLGLDVGPEAVTAVPAVLEALQAGVPYENWLLVFDNAEALESVRSYFPQGGAGKVLVTSRNRAWGEIAETLEVDLFTRDESISLLQRRNPHLPRPEADQLAEALGDLPLAVEHGGAWLATTNISAQQYLTLLSQKRAELMELVPTPGYEMPVAAAWNVALDRLGTENPAALQLLQVLSFFAPEPIARDLFTGPRSTPIIRELDETLQDPNKLNKAIREIQRYGLARIDHRDNTIQLHRLVQAVLVGRMTVEQRKAIEHGAHILLAGGNPGTPDKRDQWYRYQALLPHVAKSNAVNCEDAWARQLVLDIVAFYYYWGDPASCRDLAKEIVDQWRTLIGPNNQQSLQAAKWLGYVLRLLGELHEAAAINKDCYDRYLAENGPNDEGTLDAMLLVAADVGIMGDFAKARDMGIEVLQQCRLSFGDDDPLTLRAAHGLGVSLRLTGEFRAALELDASTVRRRASTLGEQHPMTLLTLNGLNIDQRECGAYLQAHARQERLYEQHQAIFGPDHPNSITAARNLAVCRRHAGDYDAARKLAEDTMNRSRRRFGNEHHETIAATLNLAVDLRQAGELERARTLAEQAADQCGRVRGNDHPYTMYVSANLAIILRLNGDARGAYERDTQIWQALGERLGLDHPLVLTCAINLASDRAALGLWQEAQLLDMETYERLCRLFGPDHPSALAAELNLSLDEEALGNEERGGELHRDMVARYRRILGPGHPATLAASQRVRANVDLDLMPT